MNFHHLSFHRKFVIVLLDFDIFFGIEFATLYSMLFRLNFGCKVWVYYYKIKRHLKNEMREKETIIDGDLATKIFEIQNTVGMLEFHSIAITKA